MTSQHLTAPFRPEMLQTHAVGSHFLGPFSEINIQKVPKKYLFIPGEEKSVTSQHLTDPCRPEMLQTRAARSHFLGPFLEINPQKVHTKIIYLFLRKKKV